MIEYIDVTTIILGLLIVAKVVVRLTPTKKDDAWFIKIMKVVESLGLPDVQAKKGKKR